MNNSELSIYNTLTRKKERFEPLEAGKINMYVCGLTTYDYAHIGHARMLVAFDVIVRYLRYLGFQVTYVRNITDIDDKILRRANENGEYFEDLTARFIEATHEDERALFIMPPDKEPRATAHISEIIALIERLIAADYAYRAENGDVYYAVRQFKGYGKLSNKNPEELLAGARIEVGELKRDPRDFALWKSASDSEVGWDSPWGYGRPGWHIECSAMSTCCLGDSFDIHGGGSDLMFPHHENEIAQSEAATGKQFAKYWLHNGAVRVDNEKMSKSLGNFFTVRDVLKSYPAEVVRYLLVASHYRSPINYSDQGLKQASASLERLYLAVRGLDTEKARDLANSSYEKTFRAAMNDDFNTSEAISVLFDLAKEINKIKEQDAQQAAILARLLLKLAGVLGLMQGSAEAFLRRSNDGVDAELIDSLIAQRKQARADKNWALADEIRDRLNAMNVVVEDGTDGSRWRIENQ
ncbi:cysteine--tRNA ligase [Pseudohongiella spirulinae]|uniref:Cysteine--tRNA ligase n=1 Tax=Pseudohongiella spirulinae TaxID=1249552 RepID=A0A0S2KDZ2_9GAMM|nr:cysteine--tRNA ligase [Pseudohongiella spirulinae]ALO46528.1 cysteinyl-tRNA synthetase [Pseudohongiella spirulinae]